VNILTDYLKAVQTEFKILVIATVFLLHVPFASQRSDGNFFPEVSAKIKKPWRVFS